jgi:DNA-binding NtrC family response regulator
VSQTSVVLLFVEDDPSDQRRFMQYVDAQGLPYLCVLVESFSAALEQLKQQTFDVILSDYFLADGDVNALLSSQLTVPLIIITRHADIQAVVEAMRDGAYDYVIQDEQGDYLTRIPEVIMRALHTRYLQTLENEQRILAEMLRDTAAALNSTLELDEILTRILENVKRIIPHDPPASCS